MKLLICLYWSIWKPSTILIGGWKIPYILQMGNAVKGPFAMVILKMTNSNSQLTLNFTIDQIEMRKNDFFCICAHVSVHRTTGICERHQISSSQNVRKGLTLNIFFLTLNTFTSSLLLKRRCHQNCITDGLENLTTPKTWRSPNNAVLPLQVLVWQRNKMDQVLSHSSSFYHT